MQKIIKKSRSTKKSITVTLVRPTEEDQVVTLAPCATVEEALDELDFSLPSGQSLYVGDSKAELDDKLENGDILQVIGKKEGGAETIKNS